MTQDQGRGQKRSWPIVRQHPDICLTALRKVMYQDRQSPDRESNPRSSEHVARGCKPMHTDVQPASVSEFVWGH
jgi:hypothetical protein